MNTTKTLRAFVAAVAVAGGIATTATVVAPAYAASSSLAAGQQLNVGQTLYAGSYRVVMQSDGNLVEYDGNNSAVWSSHTQGSGAFAAMQGDGNFVIYSGARAVLWVSATAPTSSDVFQLQSDGNIVIYSAGRAVWDSKSDTVRHRALAAAVTRLGMPYVYGATGPNSFDCSGLTQWSYGQVGITLQRTADNQWTSLRHIAYSQIEPGDLVFWSDNGGSSATHVGMVSDNYNKIMIEAPHTGDVVKYYSIPGEASSTNIFLGAARVVGTQP
jgi:cell wall-associated NlpC family hydrolase